MYDLPRTVVPDGKASHPLAKKSVQPSHAITKSFPADLFEDVNGTAEFVGSVIGISLGLVLGASYVLTVFTLKGIYRFGLKLGVILAVLWQASLTFSKKYGDDFSR